MPDGPGGPDASIVRLRPNDTPQLFARLARRVLAVSPAPDAPASAFTPFTAAPDALVGSATVGKSGEPRAGWYDVVRARRWWCASTLESPSVGEPSGDALRPPDEPDPEPAGLLNASDVDARELPGASCSEASAVVAMPLEGPPANGSRAVDRREETERREAREPERNGSGTAMLCGVVTV